MTIEKNELWKWSFRKKVENISLSLSLSLSLSYMYIFRGRFVGRCRKPSIKKVWKEINYEIQRGSLKVKNEKEEALKRKKQENEKNAENGTKKRGENFQAFLENSLPKRNKKKTRN